MNLRLLQLLAVFLRSSCARISGITKVGCVVYRTREPRTPMTGLSLFANSRDERGHGARSAHAVPSNKAIYLRNSVLPAVIIAAGCLAAAAYALVGNVPAATLRAVLAGVAVGVAVMLIAVIISARAISRRVTSQVRAARVLAQRGQAEIQQMVERLLRGEQPAPLVPAPARPADDDPFRMLTHDLEQSQYVAGQAVLRIADKVFGGRSDQRVEIFVNLARRMQSLVHREIELLDDLEARVEDPDLLKGLFTVDHLATRMRRQSESLAVLGGAVSRRQWSRPVTMQEVLRAAVAEVVENATKFSAPHTQVLLRAQNVTAGLAVEVEDRGLGMPLTDQQRVNG